MRNKLVGVLGATSLVGQILLKALLARGWRVRAFSRKGVDSRDPRISWIRLPLSGDYGAYVAEEEKIESWICLASLWVLPDYFSMFRACGAKRIIALSSTSRFTKSDSPDIHENLTARRLSEGEDRLQVWAKAEDIDWVILRPTLIYGCGQDKNISEIIRLIRRFGFFPLVGKAAGLRQPVHAEDIATACLSVLENPVVANHAYNLSGGETLSYREMINRVFEALGLSPRVFCMPLWSFHLAAILMKAVPRYRHWTAQMAERMNEDLVFDHEEAARDFCYSPRLFQLTSKDLPQTGKKI